MPTLLEKINNRTCVVGVIGLGYVGLPLAKAFHDVGMPVIGFDVDPAKIRDLKEGVNYLLHFGPDYCRQMAKSGKFTPTADFKTRGVRRDHRVCADAAGQAHGSDLSYVVKTTG